MTINTLIQSNEKPSVATLNKLLSTKLKEVEKLNILVEPLDKSTTECYIKLGRLDRKGNEEGIDVSPDKKPINDQLNSLKPKLDALIKERKEKQNEVLHIEELLVEHDKEIRWRKNTLLWGVKSYSEVDIEASKFIEDLKSTLNVSNLKEILPAVKKLVDSSNGGSYE